MQAYNLDINQKSPRFKQNELATCEICTMSNLQIKCILMHLLDTLKVLELKQGENMGSDENGGFLKLLKNIFHSKCKNFRGTAKCSHTKTQKFFLENLGISSSVLDKKCNIKLVSIAKYNFHADTISNQVKSFHRHFSNLGQRKEISSILTQKTDLTQKKAQKTKIKQSLNKEPTVKSQYEIPSFINPPVLPQNNEYFSNTSFNYPQQYFYGNNYESYLNNIMMLGYGYNSQGTNNK